MLVKKIIRYCLSACIFLFFGCGSDSIPKPYGYYRIDLPEKQYQELDTVFPYRFSYPVYGVIVADKGKGDEKYWINIEFKKYKAKIHISYKTVNKNIESLIEDSRKLAYKHTVKADAINEMIFTNPEKKVFGTLYNIEGNAASQHQFYLTDSVHHFIRGALYFNVQPNKDSLAPVIDFFKKDMIHLIESLEWKW